LHWCIDLLLHFPSLARIRSLSLILSYHYGSIPDFKFSLMFTLNWNRDSESDQHIIALALVHRTNFNSLLSMTQNCDGGFYNIPSPLSLPPYPHPTYPSEWEYALSPYIWNRQTKSAPTSQHERWFMRQLLRFPHTIGIH